MPDNRTFNALTIREELRGFIRRALADEGSPMDSGGGLGQADLWVWIGGREFIITVRDTGNKR